MIDVDPGVPVALDEIVQPEYKYRDTSGLICKLYGASESDRVTSIESRGPRVV